MIIEVKNQNQLKRKRLRQKKPDEIQKPLWIKLKNDFDLLTEDVYNNLNNHEFKTTAEKKAFDLKNAKKFLCETTTKKISSNKTRKVYDELIKPETDVVKKSKSKSTDKRNNIISILSNLESAFTVFYCA